MIGEALLALSFVVAGMGVNKKRGERRVAEYLGRTELSQCSQRCSQNNEIRFLVQVVGCVFFLSAFDQR
jgi:hypothetical protein